jgi:ribose transport system substrate-binding protein
LCCAVAAGALLAASAGARAADPYTFALVPKSTDNPFYDQALARCKKAEAELKGAIKCLYIGPPTSMAAETSRRRSSAIS